MYTQSAYNAARTVEPYQLVLKSGHWYFQGYCHERKDFRLFGLSRITNLQLKAETPPDKSQKEHGAKLRRAPINSMPHIVQISFFIYGSQNINLPF
ncbi:WYL domain-containing protein [Eubacterium maltosivorans]|uniref:WYL domain-containing protein n=1 Tax=Eubacterium maltosivorans TaxID=2041044 RepID=A0A4P9C3C0_EUBML|nr:WYL domain-containing protein [Eubacterium maltosivorans]